MPTWNICLQKIEGMDEIYTLSNKVFDTEFRAIAYNWLAEGEYTPDDIIENIVTSNSLVLFPFYHFEHQFSGSCSFSLASIHSYNYYSIDKNGNRVKQQKADITWTNKNLPINGQVNILAYAGEYIDAPWNNFIERTVWKPIELIKRSFSSDKYNYFMRSFKASKETVWNDKAVYRAYDKALEHTKNHMKKQYYKDLNLSIKFDEVASYHILAPFWLFTYDYAGDKYYIIVDGNDSTRVEGTKPQDNKRKGRIKNIRRVGWNVHAVVLLAMNMFRWRYEGTEIYENRSQLIFGAGIGLMILNEVIIRDVIKSIKAKSLAYRKAILSEKLRNRAS